MDNTDFDYEDVVVSSEYCDIEGLLSEEREDE